MKKITQILGLGILFLFATTLSLSAQKCKFDYNKKDPITGEATKGNTVTISKIVFVATNNYNWKLGFHRAGDSYHVGVSLEGYGNFRERIQKGDPITFVLSNGEIVTINSQDEFLPTARAAQVVVTEYKGKYDIDVAALQKIAENPPTFIRMNVESKVYEKEINSATGKQIAQAARCILQ